MMVRSDGAAGTLQMGTLGSSFSRGSQGGLTTACCRQDEELLKSVLAYYRLMAAWMLRMASPAAAAGAQPQLPLPTPAPEHFRMLPVRYPTQWMGNNVQGLKDANMFQAVFHLLKAGL